MVGFETTLHKFRHLFATEVYRACLDVVATSRLLGHASVDTTMIYVHVSGEEGRDAVSQVGRLLRPTALVA
jgi:site-specific recombinase XerD